MMKKWGVGVFVYRLQPQAQLGQMNPSSWCQNNTQCDEESFLLLSSVHNFNWVSFISCWITKVWSLPHLLR